MKPDIDAIRERAEKATPGPWRVSGDINHMVFTKSDAKDNRIPLIADCGHLHNADTKQHVAEMQNNAAFIANARTDIPALLAYIAELERERDAAVIDMKLLANEYGFCDMCKYFNSQQACEEPHPGLLCAEHKKWEWRGVKK